MHAPLANLRAKASIPLRPARQQRTKFAERTNAVGLQRLLVEFADIYMWRLAISKAANILDPSSKTISATEVNEAGCVRARVVQIAERSKWSTEDRRKL